MLNREGLRFIPLANAQITGLNGDQPEQLNFIAVAHDHVQIAYEDEGRDD